MRDDICTIPVSEVFEPRDGCPICRLRTMLEERVIEFVLGPAMMEPDVRIKTNQLGFCLDHLQQMLARRNKLQLALILDSHLAELQKSIFGEGKPALLRPGAGKKNERAARVEETCFICEQINRGTQQILETVLHLYENESSFRRLFSEQEVLCLPHFRLLSQTGEKGLSKRFRTEFSNACTSLAQTYLDELHKDVRHFCDMFDYRNNTEDADWGNSKDSLERAVWWLTGHQANE